MLTAIKVVTDAWLTVQTTDDKVMVISTTSEQVSKYYCVKRKPGFRSDRWKVPYVT